MCITLPRLFVLRSNACSGLKMLASAELKTCEHLENSSLQEELCMKIFYSPLYTIATYSFERTRKSRWSEPIVGIDLVAPEPARAAALSRVHDPEYVDAVRTGNPRELAKSQGFDWDSALWKMVCRSNGGVVAAVIEALRAGPVSGSLSSGLHHARRARGAGFCTFNGLVLAARAALDAGAHTVLILDLDAHCGGGTHELIQGDKRIWQMDVAVDDFDRYEPLGNNQLEMVHDGSGYLPTIERKLTWLEREAPRFDICLYNAGMDPFEGCSIGEMQGVTQKVLRDREAAVFSWCRMRGVPIAFVLAGGYLGPELESSGLVAAPPAHSRSGVRIWRSENGRLGRVRTSQYRKRPRPQKPGALSGPRTTCYKCLFDGFPDIENELLFA
jgi:acetoin utilization deacetylase AcuC-like enzyme